MANADPVKISIVAEVKGLTEGLKLAMDHVQGAVTRMQSSFDSLSGGVDKLKGPFLALSGVLAGGDMFKAAMATTVEWTMGVNKLSKVLNTNLKDASAWAVALKTLGLSSEDLSGIVQKLQVRLVGNGAAFDKWGVATKDAHGRALPMTQVIEHMATKYKSLNTDQERNAMLAELGGRGWMALLPVMRLTTQRMDEARAEAEALHLIVGPEGVAKTREYQESLRKLELIEKSMQVQVGNELMPALIKLGAWLGKTGPGMAAGMAVALKALSTAFFLWKANIEIVTSVAYTHFAVLWDILKNLAIAWYRFMTLDFKGAWNILNSGWTELKIDVLSGAESIKAAVMDALRASADLWSGTAMPKAVVGNEDVPADVPEGEGNPGRARGKGRSKPGRAWEREAAEAAKMARKLAEEKAKYLDECSERELEGARKLAGLRWETELEAQGAALEQQKKNLAWAVEDGKLTRLQELQELKALRGQELDLDLSRLQKEQAANADDLVKWQELQNKIVEARRKAAAEMAQIDRQTLLEQRKLSVSGGLKAYLVEARSALREYGTAAQGAARGVESAFANSAKGILTGQMTLTQSLTALWQGIRDAVIGQIAEMAAKWITSKLLEMIIGRTAAVSGAASSAALYATNAMASVAAIPFTGWAMAPAVGAEAYATGMGYAALASAARGYDIPAGLNPITQLHEREMVLPRREADTIRSLGEGGRSGGNHFHFHGVTDRTWWDHNKSHIARTLKEMQSDRRRA